VVSPLLTDLYQLTMAYGYWKLNIHEREAVFHQIYRKNPFQGNYAVACGLGAVIEFLQDWRFQDDDLAYLSGLESNGLPLFPAEFLDYLKTLHFTCDVDAIPEGTVIFPHLPLLRITGPLLQGQLIESTLLNLVNFQTLIATKAARVCQAAQGDPVLEFGMRRSQGPDGALSASRAAYIGGCAATSNVLAGKLYDIPLRGTHAHSWVTVFPDEITAFSAYAKVMPHNCVLLVDTYDTIQGVKNAIEVGKQLRAEGSVLAGVRLDSGDMTGLSIQARELLDEAGFTETNIIASNSLDEYAIEKMKSNHAKVNVWGVGTSLMTAYDHPALDGVYKLAALRDEEGRWQYKLKLSEQAVKISNPGIYQVRRFFRDDEAVLDVMYDLELGIDEVPEMVSLASPHAITKVAEYDGFVDLLEPVFRKGKCVYPVQSIHETRDFAMQEVASFIKSQGRTDYAVGLEKKSHALKQSLILQVSKRDDRK
jgi:nicotinate phosphoribosyltransferase